MSRRDQIVMTEEEVSTYVNSKLTMVINSIGRDGVPHPAPMWFAGPREALFHALVRRNYGCTHLILGRDHAGVGKYYGPMDAQKIFSRFPVQEIGIQPIFFSTAFYCRKCASTATRRSCPHDPKNHLSPSGTRVRESLHRGNRAPEELIRAEVWEVLASGETRS